MNFKEVFEDLSEVTLDRKYNDKSIKKDIKEIEKMLKAVQKRLDKLKLNDYTDEKSNKVRGDLTVFLNKYSSLDSSIPAIYAKDKK